MQLQLQCLILFWKVKGLLFSATDFEIFSVWLPVTFVQRMLLSAMLLSLLSGNYHHHVKITTWRCWLWQFITTTIFFIKNTSVLKYILLCQSHYQKKYNNNCHWETALSCHSWDSLYMYMYIGFNASTNFKAAISFVLKSQSWKSWKSHTWPLWWKKPDNALQCCLQGRLRQV